MHKSFKKITVKFVVLLLLAGCNLSYSVDKIDSDNNGKTDMLIYWNKNGSISKLVLLGPENSRPDVRIPSEPQEVTVDNERLNKQESINRFTNQKSNIYTKPFALVLVEIHSLKGELIRIYYKNNLTSKVEIDSNKDNKIDIWGHYEKGSLTRTEKDTNFDGIVDQTK